MDLLVKNACVLSEGGKAKKSDILVSKGKIARIAAANTIVSKGCEKLDATGKIAIRGFANCHTHAPMSILRGISDDLQTEQWLEKKIWPAEKKLDEKAIYAGAMLANIEMIKSGTTVFNDMYFGMEAVANAAQKSGMRTVLGHGMVDLGDEGKRKKELKAAEDFIKKINVAKNPLISANVAPHAIYTCSEELLLEAKALAKKYGTTMHIHVSETRKEVFDCLKATGKRPVEYLGSIGFLGQEVIAAHCVWLTIREVKLLGKSKTKACLNPVSNMKLASGGVPCVPEMIEENVGICLGTDGAASNNSLSMFESMKFVSLLVKNARWDATLVRAKQAFDFATQGGYCALGLDSGKLEVGALADIIMLDAKAANLNPQSNLHSNIVFAGNAGNVVDSIIGGKIVMQGRKLVNLDEEREVENAQKEFVRLGLAN